MLFIFVFERGFPTRLDESESVNVIDVTDSMGDLEISRVTRCRENSRGRGVLVGRLINRFRKYEPIAILNIQEMEIWKPRLN